LLERDEHDEEREREEGATHRPVLPALPRAHDDDVARPQALLSLAPLRPRVGPLGRAPPAAPPRGPPLPLPLLVPLLLLKLVPALSPRRRRRRRKAPARPSRLAHARAQRALEPRPEPEVAREVHALARERPRASSSRARRRRRRVGQRRARARARGGEVRPVVLCRAPVRAEAGRAAALGAEDDGRSRVRLGGGRARLARRGRVGEARAPVVVQAGREGDDGRCGGCAGGRGGGGGEAEGGREGRRGEAVDVDRDERRQLERFLEPASFSACAPPSAQSFLETKWSPKRVKAAATHQCGSTTTMPSSVPNLSAISYLWPCAAAHTRCVTSRVSSRRVWPPSARTAACRASVSGSGSCEGSRGVACNEERAREEVRRCGGRGGGDGEGEEEERRARRQSSPQRRRARARDEPAHLGRAHDRAREEQRAVGRVEPRPAGTVSSVSAARTRGTRAAERRQDAQLLGTEKQSATHGWRTCRSNERVTQAGCCEGSLSVAARSRFVRGKRTRGSAPSRPRPPPRLRSPRSRPPPRPQCRRAA